MKCVPLLSVIVSCLLLVITRVPLGAAWRVFGTPGQFQQRYVQNVQNRLQQGAVLGNEGRLLQEKRTSIVRLYAVKEGDELYEEILDDLLYSGDVEGILRKKAKVTVITYTSNCMKETYC